MTARAGWMLAVWLLSGGAAHGDEPARGARSAHVAAGVGGHVAATGPAGYGAAAELEIYPGGRFDRFGFGVYYRGFHDALAEGAMTAGIAYEAGAARPRLTLVLHGDVGYDWNHEQPVLGGGVRVALALSGPFAVAANSTAHLFYDGIDSRLGLAVAVTAGVMR